MKNLNQILGLLAILVFFSCSEQVEITDELVESYWHSGKTLPVEASRKYPWPQQKVEDDSGINVLVDLAHQCSFASMWDTPGLLNRLGFRSVGSMASLNSILKEGGQSRIRIYYRPEDKLFPFAWWDNPEFNVVITQQSSPESQHYTPEEIESLVKFVAKGGGLIVLSTPHQDKSKLEEWSLNKLLQRFGCSLNENIDKWMNRNYQTFSVDDSWTTLRKGDKGEPIAVGTQYKKGYVVAIGNQSAFQIDKKDPQKTEITKSFMKETLLWASQGKNPIGGDAFFPKTMGGGGGIYPEKEQQMGNIVLYYAENQKEDLLHCVREDVPIAMEKVEAWLPSKPTAEPMYLLLAAGDGGGWAVNAFKPKENGIISLSRLGILSIFGHELAHTMAGPLNEKGEKAGHSPIPNQGEAHAGWFQGKVDAVFNESLLTKSNRNCNSIFEKEGVLTELDLSKHYENEEGRKIWGQGTAWTKVWYIWQKLDDRYGTTWYPRWRWIQHSRWAEQPDKRLSWEEMVEDMSITVGEDLFPFFIKLGTSLQRETMGEVDFLGESIQLAPAPIEPTPAGNVRLDDIGDYTQPLKY